MATDAPIPRQCTAKSARTGLRCRKFAIHGGTVCDRHGGRAPQVKRAAARRVAVEKARKLILTPEPVDDPIEKLLELAADAVALKDALKSHVEELERVGTNPGDRWGEQVRPELDAYLRSLRECERVLASIARLDLQERMVRLDEARAELVVQVIERVLRRAGVDPKVIDVRSSVARELERVSG
jgi:hypothetical protein